MDKESSSTSNKRRNKSYFHRGGGGGGGGARNGGGGGGGKKARRDRLEPGARGFIVTCSNKDESKCVREAYNLLNEYADRLIDEEKGGEKGAPGKTAEGEDKEETSRNSPSSDHDDNDDDDDDDPEAAMKKERDAMLGTRTVAGAEDEKSDIPGTGQSSTRSFLRRFTALDTGVNNVVFVGMAPSTCADLDPCRLVQFILRDAKNTGTCKSRFIQRLLPVDLTCKAYPDDISAALLAHKDLLSKHFAPSDSSVEPPPPPPSYAIFYKCRNNDHLTRPDVLRVVGDMITGTNPMAKVDLDNPKKAVLVEVLRTNACISIVDDYVELCKYNLHLVAEKKGQQQVQT